MIPYQVQDLKALLRSDLHSDITFLVDGHKINAHKVRTFQSVLTPSICFLLVKKKRNPICNKMGILSYEFFEFRNLKFSEFWSFRVFLFLCSNFSFSDFIFFQYFRIFSILIFLFTCSVSYFISIFILFIYSLFYLFIYLFILFFIFYFFSDFVYEMSVLPSNVHGRVRREQRGRGKKTNKLSIFILKEGKKKKKFEKWPWTIFYILS